MPAYHPHHHRPPHPNQVLADRNLWPAVSERVRADMSVRVVPAGYPGAAVHEEGWFFQPAVLSPSGGLLSPNNGGVLSPAAMLSPAMGEACT